MTRENYTLPEDTQESASWNRRTLLRRGALATGAIVAAGAGTRVLAQDATPTARPIEDSGRYRFSTFGWATDFSIHSVDLLEIAPGGPGKDGIPPIDDPRYESIDSANAWLNDLEPVVSVAIETPGGPVARAYPIQILIWHEMVNDVLADEPILATFCPLCNTAIAFDRKLADDGIVYDFGTTGNLRFSDLVMWDRQTESWWQQLTGEAIVGTLTGSQLMMIPAQILGWGTFKTLYPEGDVLSVETGFSRTYGSNPYVGYDDADSSPFLFDRPADGRLRPMERVVGVDSGGEQKAYLVGDVTETDVINDDLGGLAIAVFLSAGAASATDGQNIATSRDVGQVGVFLSAVDDQVLTFALDGDRILDAETGTSWDLSGAAIDGPLEGARLTALPHVVVFWFAWAAAFPETSIWNNGTTITPRS